MTTQAILEPIAQIGTIILGMATMYYLISLEYRRAWKSSSLSAPVKIPAKGIVENRVIKQGTHSRGNFPTGVSESIAPGYMQTGTTVEREVTLVEEELKLRAELEKRQNLQK